MNLPSKIEINPYPGDLDGDYAEKNWLGVSIEEGARNLAENSFHYGEDFRYMGPVAFAYYLQSAVMYAKSAASSDDADFLNVFVGIIEARLADEEQEAVRLSKDVCQALLGVFMSDYAKFDVDQNIYGDLRARAKRCHEQVLIVAP